MTPTIFTVGSEPPEAEDVIPGTIVHFAGTTSPSGYLECDGTDYLQSDYPPLFAALGATWDTFRGQAAPGAGRFRVPLLNGLSPMYAGGAKTNPSTSARTLATALGEEGHQLIVPEMPSHAHTISDPGHTHDFSPDYVPVSSGTTLGGTNGADFIIADSTTQQHATPSATTAISVQVNGGNGFHNTVHPVAVVRALIKT